VGVAGALGLFLSRATRRRYLSHLTAKLHGRILLSQLKLGFPMGLWIAAGYQLFDGLNIGSSACLRGAGDLRLPALMVLGLSWLFFVPLAHSLSFAPGAGWVDWLPRFGFGAVGGRFAALAYVCCLGLTLWLRWRSGAWRRITLLFH